MLGVTNNVGNTNFPKQGNDLNKRSKVCFNYDMNNLFEGTIVRDDREEPFITIIELDDGRFVRSTECQYTILK